MLLSKPGQVAPVYQSRTAEQWLGQVFTTNQTAALAIFQQMGLEAIPVLVRAFEKSDSRWDKFYQWAYPKLPSLVRVRLSTPVPARMTWSAASLVLLNHRAYRSEPGKVLPELLRLLEDKKNQAHAYIIGPVIGVVGPNSTNCLPALIRCLQATEPDVRREAAVGLEQIGPSAKAAVPDLTAVLKDPDLEVRIFAARALWKTDRQTNSTAPVFEEALKTLRPRDLQNMTAVFLSEVNPDSPVLLPVFIEALEASTPSHSDYGFRSALVVKLRRYGPSAHAAVPVLVRMIKEKDILSHLAGQTLQKIDPAEARKWEINEPNENQSECARVVRIGFFGGSFAAARHRRSPRRAALRAQRFACSNTR